MSKVVDSSLNEGVAQARQQLRTVARWYAVRRVATVLLPAIAGAVLMIGLGQYWPAAQSALLVVAGLEALVVSMLLRPIWKVGAEEIAPRLDRQFAKLEDSTGLLLRNPEDLNLLERLQQQRVARWLWELQAAKQLTLPVDFRRAAWTTGVLLILGAAVWWWPAARKLTGPTGVVVHFSPDAKPGALGRVPARIVETVVRVTPPAYTRLPPFAPAQASFQCPQGARVQWRVTVSGASKSVPELEIGRQRRRLLAVAGQANTFVIEQTINASTLYRLRFNGTVSDDYAIDVRADQPPAVHIISPKPYTLVAAIGQLPEVPIRATVRDDYGLSRAELVITVAQGQGEAVKFREVRRDLSAGLGGQPQARLTSLLNLPKLGLTYGDELYFYISARDNNGHTARTDSYLVQWQDTAVADSAPDMGMGVKVAPAYFRSERQIIIDTEKLIAEKPRLDAATVASRANALGFDQQTLRLRYGKFMGEEAEAGIGVTPPHSPTAEDDDAPAAPTADAPQPDEHEHAAPPTSSTKASPTAETDALMEPYMHRHDDAETADFLEPAVKAKLRAVLDQMWAAELRLRTGQLKAALPYEYRALRLLKQVQQQTRAFVKKAGFTPPPMPEATLRLTGELAGAAVPHRQQTLPAPATQPAVRAALRWLTANRARPNAVDTRLLEQAGNVLAGAALQRPGEYLPALRALRQLVADARAGRPACATCRPPVERALTDMLAAPAQTPAAPPTPDRLARRYFQELSH